VNASGAVVFQICTDIGVNTFVQDFHFIWI